MTTTTPEARTDRASEIIDAVALLVEEAASQAWDAGAADAPGLLRPDDYDGKVQEVKRLVTALAAECERMLPVVEAANRAVGMWAGGPIGPASLDDRLWELHKALNTARTAADLATAPGPAAPDAGGNG